MFWNVIFTWKIITTLLTAVQHALLVNLKAVHNKELSFRQGYDLKQN